MIEPKMIGKMRKRLGLTQKRLADLAGVSQSLVAKIESGKIDPAYSKVKQIVSALQTKESEEKKTAKDIMSSNIVSVGADDTMDKAVRIMMKRDISQLPVLESDKCVGSLSDSMVLELVSKKHNDLKSIAVREIMAESFPIIPANSLVDVATDLLRYYAAVLIEKNGRLVGIVTKADLLKAI